MVLKLQKLSKEKLGGLIRLLEYMENDWEFQYYVSLRSGISTERLLDQLGTLKCLLKENHSWLLPSVDLAAEEPKI